MKKIFLILLIFLITMFLSSCDGPKKNWDRCDIYIRDVEMAISQDAGKLYTKYYDTYYDIIAQKKGHMWYMWIDTDLEPLEYEEQFVECVDIPENDIKIIEYNPVYSDYKWTVPIEIRNGLKNIINIENINVQINNINGDVIAKQDFVIKKTIEPINYIHLRLTFDKDNTYITHEESLELKSNVKNIKKDVKVTYNLVE